MLNDRAERYINPYTEQDRVFKKLFEQAEIAQYSDSERRLYEASQKEYWDYTSTLETAENKGIAKGRVEEKYDIARNLKKMGMSDTDIAQATGLSKEELAQL